MILLRGILKFFNTLNVGAHGFGYNKMRIVSSMVLLKHSLKYLQLSRSSGAIVKFKSKPVVHLRQYSQQSQPEPDEEDGQKLRSLHLMEFPKLVWPNPLKTIRNFIFSFLIRRSFDPEFTTESFLEGASVAIHHVSHLIGKGSFSELQGLVVYEAIQEIERNYRKLSAKQRQCVPIDLNDIYMHFIYEIGIIFDEENSKRFVEITTVAQGYHNLDKSKHAEFKKSPRVFDDDKMIADNFYVCNYRFIREYSKGVAGDWSINKLNHFLPRDIQQNEIFRR